MNLEGKKEIEINLLAPIRLVHRLLPHLPEEVATAVVKAIKAGRHEINVGRAKALSIIARITPRGALKMVNG